MNCRFVLIAAALFCCANTALAADWPEPKMVESNGISMAVYEMGDGMPVVFSHGFPELAYSWRYQLSALAEAGYHAIAPDQRGYGKTDAPEDIEAYDIAKLTGDLVGILDDMGYEKAVFVGHDWGGLVVWMMPLLHPDRVAGVVGVNTPFMPRTPVPPIQMLRAMRGENNYIVAFQEPGVADAALEKDVRKTFEAFMRKGGFTAEEFAKLPPDAPERNFELLTMLEADAFPGELLLDDAEMDMYVNTFEKTGFTGGVNWYRNIDRNWELTEGVEQKINVPCLYIGAEDDVVLPPSMAAGMENFIPDLEKHVIEDCGHWTQQEKPDELNRVLIDWLDRTFGGE
jgi:pimeloyl-ACP methyl ester carboxylesterase